MPSSSPNRHQHSPEQIDEIRRRHVLLLGLLVLLVYASALGGGFVWTDREDLLQGGYRLTSLSDLPAALGSSRQAYRARSSGANPEASAGTWQPLTLLSNSVSWGLWGDCAFCFHLENILLHFLLVVGLYALGRHLLSQRRHGNRIAAWAAALFAVHPATVTSVAWIGGRPYLLAAALGIWSLVVFTRLQATTKSHRGHVRRWLLILALASMAAMLADETAYLLPLAALLIAAYESKERGRGALLGIAPVRWRALGLLLLTLLLLLTYRRLVLGGLDFTAGYPTDSVFNNIGTALRHLWFFIEQALLPSEPVISDAWPITHAWGSVEVAALLGLLLILGATIIGLRLHHPSAFGAAWFLLWLLPGLGMFPSDHYHTSQTLYLAVWGVAFAASYGLFRLWRPVGRQMVPGSEAVVFVPLILILGVITGLSNVRWWDHKALFESEIASDPHYIEGRLQLAAAALEDGEAAIALNHGLAAVEAARDTQFTGYWSARDAYYLLGMAQSQMGLDHEAAGSFATALEARPGDAQLLYRLGLAQLVVKDFEGAESNLRLALEARQPFPEAEADLGVVLADQGRFVESYPLLADTIARGFGNARRHRAMALTMLDARQYRDAVEHLEQSLALKENAEERARLAWTLWQLGESDQAHSHLNMAMLMEEDQTSKYVEWVREEIQAAPEDAQIAEPGDDSN
jgi:tetratricopeptide (TPR) repeat protein